MFQELIDIDRVSLETAVMQTKLIAFEFLYLKFLTFLCCTSSENDKYTVEKELLVGIYIAREYRSLFINSHEKKTLVFIVTV